MKKFSALLFVSVIVFSTCILPAYASGDIHIPNGYKRYTENMHTFECEICHLTISDYHSFDINGNCDCGYFRHSHRIETYKHYNENMHAYECKDCGVLISEYHDFDVNGECGCGYFRHGHRIGTYKHYNENMHTYECKDCGVLISEYHDFDVNGECDCGYFKHNQEPITEPSFCDLLLSFLISIFKLILSLFGI